MALISLFASSQVSESLERLLGLLQPIRPQRRVTVGPKRSISAVSSQLSQPSSGGFSTTFSFDIQAIFPSICSIRKGVVITSRNASASFHPAAKKDILKDIAFRVLS